MRDLTPEELEADAKRVTEQLVNCGAKLIDLVEQVMLGGLTGGFMPLTFSDPITQQEQDFTVTVTPASPKRPRGNAPTTGKIQ